MGGDYYDREVISVGDKLFGNEDVGKQDGMNAVLDPRQRNIQIETKVLNPIVFGLDITGSMGDWSKIIYDKLPMFYGQIMINKYLKDPALSFCAIGDAISDRAPLQVTNFGQGKELDSYLSKIWIQKGGGSSDQESYELAAYFYNRHISLPNKQTAYFFITGDQDYYTNVAPAVYEKIIGGKITDRIYGQKQFNILKQNYEVFLLRKTYPDNDEKIYKHWCETLGEERVMTVESPKGCVDVILGIIAMTSCARDLADYLIDMEERGQSEERIKEVGEILTKYQKHLISKQHFKDYKPIQREKKQKVEEKQTENVITPEQLREKAQVQNKSIILPVEPISKSIIVTQQSNKPMNPTFVKPEEKELKKPKQEQLMKDLIAQMKSKPKIDSTVYLLKRVEPERTRYLVCNYDDKNVDQQFLSVSDPRFETRQNLSKTTQNIEKVHNQTNFYRRVAQTSTHVVNVDEGNNQHKKQQKAQSESPANQNKDKNKTNQNKQKQGQYPSFTQQSIISTNKPSIQPQVKQVKKNPFQRPVSSHKKVISNSKK